MHARSDAALEITREVEESHSRLSRSAREFLDYVRNDPDCFEASRYRSLDVRNEFLRYPLQGWPVLVSDRVMGQMGKVSVDVCALFRRIPEVFFDHDPARMVSYYGFSKAYADLVVEALRDRGAVDALLSRGDFVLTNDGLKCIELNASSYLGGWESHIWTEMVLGVPEIRKFLDGLGRPYRYGDVGRAFFRHSVSRAIDCGLCDDEINMAFAIPPGQRRAGPIETYGRRTLREVVGELTGSQRGELYFCRFEDLRERMGCLFLEGKRIHVLVEQYQGEINPQVFRCGLRGAVHVYNGLPALLFADKRNLALLSELASRESLSDEEREVSRRHVPWTREIKAGRTTYEDDELELAELLLAGRERFVLKRALGAQGADVFIGKAMGAEGWKARVHYALEDERPWVVQEYCVSIPYLGQHGEVGHAPHDLIWGFFVFGDVCPGGFIRMMPKSQVGVVNAARGASEAVIIEVEES